MTRKDIARSFLRSLRLACVAAVLSGQVAWAGIQPEPFRTGLFGVVAGQTVRVSVVNAGEAAGVINPCVRVYDAAGTLLFETDAAPVPGGAGTFVDFTPAPGGAVVRAQLRVEVELLPAAHPPDPVYPPDPIRRRGVLVTVEVFDIQTGRTAFTIPAHPPDPGYPPDPVFPPDPIFPPDPVRTGLFGVTAGQSIRISVLNAGDMGSIIGPCFRVFDAAGTLLFETDAGPVSGGTGTFVDFTPAPGGALVRAQLRAEVELVPAVQPDPGHPTEPVRERNIHLTLEVFDTSTGRTTFTMPYAAVGFNPQPEPPEPIRQP